MILLSIPSYRPPQRPGSDRPTVIHRDRRFLRGVGVEDSYPPVESAGVRGVAGLRAIGGVDVGAMLVAGSYLVLGGAVAVGAVEGASCGPGRCRDVAVGDEDNG